MEKTFLLVPLFLVTLALVAFGMFLVALPPDQIAVDITGSLLIAVAGTIAVVKIAKGKKRIRLLALLCAVNALLLISGSAMSTGSILLSIMGTAIYVVFGHLLYKSLAKC